MDSSVSSSLRGTLRAYIPPWTSSKLHLHCYWYLFLLDWNLTTQLPVRAIFSELNLLHITPTSSLHHLGAQIEDPLEYCLLSMRSERSGCHLGCVAFIPFAKSNTHCDQKMVAAAAFSHGGGSGSRAKHNESWNTNREDQKRWVGW